MKYPILMLILFYLICSFLSDPLAEKMPNMTTGYIDPQKQVDEGRSLLKDGDLVVRLNRDPFSQYIKNFNPHDKRFSHSGIVLFENGRPYIYHILMGDENPNEKIKRDSLDGFCNPRKNIAYGIFRYNLNAEEIFRLRGFIKGWYKAGILFDSTFNFNSNDRMYCSEMISKALMRATNNRIKIAQTKLTPVQATIFSAHTRLPYAYTSKLSIVAIDNLYSNPDCRLVKSYVFGR